MEKTCCSVVGAGSWGTALAILCCQNFVTVKLWGRSATDELAKSRSNNRYLPGISFPSNLQVEAQLASLIDPQLNFLVVVPSHAFRTTLASLHLAIESAGLKPADATVLWGTKGFDPNTGDLLSDVVKQVFPEINACGSISGPSFAGETAKGMPTALTLAAEETSDPQSLSDCFRTPTTRVYYSTDIVGVQAGGAVKNVMAIATGISDGLGYGANARAALITRGLAELKRLGLAMGGQTETFNGLTGVGDLILTCTDNQSRNRRFGLGIGAGKTRQQIVDEIGQEIEGIQTAREVYHKARQLDIEMPITDQVYQVLYNDRSPAEAVSNLLQRQPRPEGD